MGIKRGTKCLDCQEEFDQSTNYCPNCGQKNDTHQLNLAFLIKEGMSFFFSYDSKLHRTIWGLLSQPGKVSTHFLEGQRQRYINPFKLYFSISLLFFLFNSINSSLSSFNEHSISIEDKPMDYSKLNEKSFLQVADSTKWALERDSSFQFKVQNAGFIERTFLYCDYQDSIKQTNVDSALLDLGLDNSKWNVWHYKKSWKILNLFKYPKTLLELFVSKIPLFLMLLMPVFTLFMYLFYIRQKKRYMEHLIFVFHSQTTFFLLMILSLIPEIFISLEMIWIVLVVFLIYLYKGMRNFYTQSRSKTIFKLISLMAIYTCLVLGLFLISIPVILFA